VSGGRGFPEDFLFGAATAAYQIEGAAAEDGRTDCIWDVFARVPGAVMHADDGSVACDHYHRYRDDVALMQQLGLQSYRFSTSWARVRPDGGPVNQAGLDFYSRLVDELLDAGIVPWLTLYHWDLPQALQDTGGWVNRDTVEHFVEYATTVFDALSDRVQFWTTLNEPWCSSFKSYTSGGHAPGHRSPREGLAAAHHLLLAHGRAVSELRRRNADRAFGITLNLTVPDPLHPDDPGDLDAARRIDAQHNRVFLDPIFRGRYPDDLLTDVAGLGLLDVVREGDLAIIASPIDFLGVNYYQGEACSYTTPAQPLMGDAPVERPTRSPFPAADGVHAHPRGLPLTDMQWEIQPEGLKRLLLRVWQEYSGPAGVPIYVTENGAAFDDVLLGPPGAREVHDPARAAFLREHLGALQEALAEGADVRGYFYWSLMDNYEWAWGYSKRFGLIYVDYPTQERIIKDSGVEYAEIIAHRSLAGSGSGSG
jgi:beta-galactosidase